MTRWYRHALLLVALALPVTAHAAVVPWVSGHVGASSYAMDDVNDELDAINLLLALDGIPLRMDMIDKGATYGLAFGLDLGDGLSLGAAYDRLSGQSRVSDPTGAIEYDLPANLIRLLGRYEFTPAQRSSGFVEASVGRVSLAGDVTFSAYGSGSDVGELSGSSLAFEFGAGARVRLAPQLGLLGSVGYRHASVGEVEVDGMRVMSLNGGEYSVDYSGVFARLGIQLAFDRP